ncbi:MAG: DUF2652 domain-containing protein, partial [Candidatus Poribacteria bacterium]|nr:DUF2652 domain-containing protein [Candidatus Poribacteria bacterium]
MRQQGYLLVADITGYAEFSDAEELAHAENILRELFGTLIGQLKSPWEIHELGADPIFACLLDGDILQAQTLLETVENLYRLFVKKREQILQNTTCSCKACEQISVLALKLIVHHGSFIVNQVAGVERLTGEDLVVAHTLLRNRIAETTGIESYAFFTEAAANSMSLGELVHGMKIHTEIYEELGQYGGFVHDLHIIWKRTEESRRVYVDMDRLYFKFDSDFPAPLAIVWDYLTEPERWRQRIRADYFGIKGKSQGRVGVGCDQHSVKGKRVQMQTIVDWRPFDYLTIDLEIPLKGVMRQTTQLSETEDSTRVSWYFGKPTGRNLMHTLLVKFRLAFAKGK